MRLETSRAGERVGVPPGIPVLVLSRRNLLSMLEKLDDPASHRTLVAPGDGFALVGEEDAEHYAHPSRRGAPPGAVRMPTSGAVG